MFKIEKFDPDFKKNAVLLSEKQGRTVTEVAESLRVHNDLIYHWRRQMRENGELSFPGNEKMALTTDQKRIREIEKKLKDTEMERDILQSMPSSVPLP